MIEPDYRAMWEEACRERDEARNMAEAYAAAWCEDNDVQVDIPWARTPDPDHVPAVRRVVAWDGGDEITEDRTHAYKNAADLLCARASRRTTPRLFRAFWAFWVDEDRRERLADALRHRDEEAGHG